MRFRRGVLLAVLGALLAARAAAATCAGDCGGDAQVAIDELIVAVGIALEQRPAADCIAADRDGDGQVSVAELVAAVGAALAGCPSEPSPTATASPSATATQTPSATASAPPTQTQTATTTQTPSATQTPSQPPTQTPSASPSPSQTPTQTASVSPTASATVRPNFIIIQLDDTRADGIDRMPVTLQKLAAEGVRFHNSFVPYPLCAPSRASLLSGLYALHHRVRAVSGPIGGADVFREQGADQQTMAVWLRDAGYSTGLFGKYINAYRDTEATRGPNGTYYVPPGWTRWRALAPERYGGAMGLDYALVDEHGVAHDYSEHGSDAQYSTDVLGAELRAFIADAVRDGTPFLAVYTPYASHADVPDLVPIPAARHFGLFDDLPDWRPPSWNEADVADKPRWVRRNQPSDLLLAVTDLSRRRAYETLLAVDEQLAATLAQLDALGIADETVMLLTSDNGVTWSEHRLYGQDKECPYEECLRVPLLARYPRGQASGHAVHDVVLNVDIAATVADLAGVEIPVPIDGRSVRAALEGRPLAAPRHDFLIEHWRATRSDLLDYSGQPQDGDQLTLLYGDPAAQPRAALRFEFDSDQQVEIGSIQVPIAANEDVSFENLGLTVAANVPHTRSVVNKPANRLSILDLSPQLDGVYWVEVRDLAGVVAVLDSVPDYFGVRDLAADLTYVEYETGERELYDNPADPWQLDNRAGSAAYAAEQARLAARVAELAER